MVSELNENYFSSRKLDLYKWCVFKAVQCITNKYILNGICKTKSNLKLDENIQPGFIERCDKNKDMTKTSK